MSWPAGEAAFITGAASGIGLGIARALVANGAKVALSDIDADRLTAVAEELTSAGGIVTTVPFDVSQLDRWPEIADHAEADIGPISILVNNAGVSGGGAIDNTPLEVWRWVYGINIDAPYAAIATFLPRFKERGGPAYILNTASMAGLVPIVNADAYVSSKFALVGLSLVLRDELAGSNVDVSLFVPGSVATRLGTTAEEAQAKLMGREPDAEVIARNSAAISAGADPDMVGEQVVQAMKDKQFLIVTHKDWLPLVDRVQNEIQQTFTDFDDRYGPDVTAQALAGGAVMVASS
jgi:short-subunit dehydrogenase